MKAKFIEFIDQLTTRPAMYSINKVEDIKLIMFGYCNALKGEERQEIDDLLSSFRVYINENSDLAGDNDWPRVIRFFSGGDRHSIELFTYKFKSFLSTLK